MENDLVSIGMPVYNDKEFLPIALSSLMKQSHRNFELIMSDDCSSDGSQEICIEAMRLDKRIKYIRQSKNIGISANMEFLLGQANSDYFMWAGNDDVWDENFISNLIYDLKRSSDAIMAFCDVAEINESGEIINIRRKSDIDYSGDSKLKRLKKLITVFYDGAGYGLFKTKAIKDVRFPIWWGVNKIRAYNNIYPTLAFYLTKGNYIHSGQKPLWFNRLKSEGNINHKVPYNDSFIRGYYAFVLWKINLVIVTLKSIFLAEGRLNLIIVIFIPLIRFWFLIPVFNQFRSSLRRLIKRQIKFW